MLVSLLSTYLGFGADLPRGEVSARLEWIKRLVSSQCITYFHRFTFEQVQFLSSLISPDRSEYPDIFPDSPDFPEYLEKYPETPDLNLTAAKKL
jgi:hypothetical protein